MFLRAVRGRWARGKLSIGSEQMFIYKFDGTGTVVPAVWRIRDVYPGSRILIFTHPGSRIPDLGSQIPDPKTATKDRGEKIFFVKPYFVATNFTKLNNILFFIC